MCNNNCDPIVSGIITTYKRSPDYVRRAIQSILNQTYKNIEIILVDDSPNEYPLRASVKKMAESFGSKVIYIQHSENRGACAARNTGLNRASGEFVGFLDDDDEWLPQKVEKMLSLFSDKNTALVYCACKVIDEISNTEYQLSNVFYGGDIYDKLIYNNFVGSTSFPLIRKECLVSIRGFDINMPASQDYDVWLRLAEKFRIEYTKEVLVQYHVHEGEQIGKTTDKRINGYKKIIEKNIDYLSHNPDAFGYRLLLLAKEYSSCKQLKKCVKSYFLGCVKRPYKVKENLYFAIQLIKDFVR